MSVRSTSCPESCFFYSWKIPWKLSLREIDFSNLLQVQLYSNRSKWCIFFFDFSKNLEISILTLSWQKFLSYINQTIDLRCRSVDWLLYYRGLIHESVKEHLKNSAFGAFIQAKIKDFDLKSLFWFSKDS